ncbi:MAG: relaxase/mobilization nuclease domain-containing protein [Nocardiopsaceae bacterium]|nr:relaxase/mobilization nuclease domain-containing protein [Nocardiopsaceae bacterium]
MNNFIVPKRGDKTTPLVLYLFGPGRANEHRDQRVIAADGTLGIADGTELDINDPGDRAEIMALAAQMDAHRKAMGVQMPGGHVWHCAISLPPGEKLTDAQWAEAARTAISAMGFDDSSGRAPCRWLAVYHGPSLKGNEHIHLAVNLVREDGTFATIWRDRKTMSRVCAELERRFGLSVVHGRAGAGMPGLSRAEIERAAREGAAEPDRIRLARIVRGCAAAARTEADFVQRLRRAGVMVRPRYAPGGQTRVVGYSVALREPAGAPGRSGTRVWLGGGRLARDLTLTRLREHWKTSPQLEAEAVAEWSRRRGSQMPRSAAYRANSWEQAAAVVNRVRRELAAVPPDAGAVWAGAAREAAGVLAVWSMRLEVHRPGPLAAAADALARSAQTPIGAPRACRTGRLRDMRGVAMVASAADAGAGERMLMRQLIRLIETIADMHQARGQARQAAALAAAARTELARVQMYRAEPITAGPPPFTSPRPDRGIGR